VIILPEGKELFDNLPSQQLAELFFICQHTTKTKAPIKAILLLLPEWEKVGQKL